MSFRLMYPDVLGAIADDDRIFTDELQFAVGIFPKQAFINQPVEVVCVFQNMVDQNMQLKVGLQLPKSDKNGNLVVIDTPKSMVSVGLRPGEVGVLRMPIVALPPTPAGSGYPIRVAVRYRTPKQGNIVRPPDGGPPPSALDISPVRLQVMRDVDFASRKWNDSADIITITLDLAGKHMPRTQSELKWRYESLWTMEHMATEQKLVEEHMEATLHLATHLTHGSSFADLHKAVNDRFAQRGMVLHPGEAVAIAKIMTYAVDEVPAFERAALKGTRWFRALAQVVAHDPKVLDMRRGEIFARYMFDAIVFDAIGFGFKMLQPKVKENLGNLEERINYANRVLMWLAGHGEPDLNYVYLPLVLAGLVVNRFVTINRDENPWDLIEQLTEAQRARLRLDVPDGTVLIFTILNDLLDEAEQQLRSQRVPRE